MEHYVLGIDLGANSVGWAMVAQEPSPERANIIAGVRVFPEGTERKKNAEESRNKARREARQARRQHDRRSIRKTNLKRILQKVGLLPLNPAEYLELIRNDPYELRRKGLDYELTESEFARVLLHLNKRRGFKSSLKAGQEEKKEAKKTVEPAINKLAQEMKDAGARTLGEYLAILHGEKERIRGHYTRRSMYEQELDLLWSKQAEFKPDVWTDELKKDVHNAIFYQRPLKSQERLIGKCRLEPDKQRCPRASWFARQFRIIQDVNNLRILSRTKGERRLTAEERASLIGELMRKKTIRVSSIKKNILKLDERDVLTFERTERKELKGNALEVELRKIFGNQFEEKAEVLRNKVYEALLEEEPDEFKKIAPEKWGLTEQQINALYKIEHPQGYASFSLKAITKILPHLEAGKDLDKAITAAGYKEEAPTALNDLPPIHPDDIRNPVVTRALSETRKVVNAIVREYGKPAIIRVELARETKGTIRSRADRTKELRKREDYHKEIIERLREHNIPVNHENIEKYKLWEECNHQCPYTGRPIDFPHQLYGDSCEFDVEHILPYSRSMDNSFMNKTLCAHSENIRKHNRTPYEAYGDTKQYQQIMARVMENKNMPSAKRKRFLMKEIPPDFTQRQLRDTSYISTQVVKYLKRLGLPVKTTRGAITSELRYRWGLNSILNPIAENVKTRDDHRHHAIDAIVIAFTTQSHIHRLGQIYDNVYERVQLPSPLDPFTREGFLQQVRRAVEDINVSYRPERKVSGQINEETNYGRIKDGTFVYRVPLETITSAQIENIRDEGIKKLVKERLRHFKKPKEAFDPKENPLYMLNKKEPDKKGPIIKSVRIEKRATNLIPIRNKEGKIYRYVAPGDNHHISIFEWEEKGKIKRDAYVATRFEVLQRVQRNRKHRQKGEPLEPVICTKHPDHPDARFVMYLCKKDMFLLEYEEDGEKQEILCRVQKFDVNKNITLRPHTYAGKLSDYDKEPLIFRRNPNTLHGRKVNIDPLGRIKVVNDKAND